MNKMTTNYRPSSTKLQGKKCVMFQEPCNFITQVKHISDENSGCITKINFFGTYSRKDNTIVKHNATILMFKSKDMILIPMLMQILSAEQSIKWQTSEEYEVKYHLIMKKLLGKRLLQTCNFAHYLFQDILLSRIEFLSC